MTKEERQRLERALSEFPGVNYEVQRGKRHEQVIIKAGDKSAFVVKSNNPRHTRSSLNFIADVKRTARNLIA